MGVSPGRYSNWVNDTHEPDLETLARVVAVLGMTADEALGITPMERADPDGPLRSRADIAIREVSGIALAGAVRMLEALARAAAAGPEDPGEQKQGSSGI